MRFLNVFFILLLAGLLISCSDGSGETLKEEQSVPIDTLASYIALIGNEFKQDNKDIFQNVLQEIKALDSDSLKGKYLSDLSYALYRHRDSIHFRQANSALEQFAISNSDTIRLAETYWDRGAFFNWPAIAERDSAIYYLSKTLKLFQAVGRDLETAKVLRSIAGTQTDIHDNTGALTTLTQAIEILKPLESYEELFRVYNLMGIASAALMEFDEALEYYALAKENYTKTNLKQIELAGIENNVGLAYYDKGDYARAKIEYKKAISRDSLFEKQPAGYARLLDNLAMTDFHLGDMTSVEDKLYRSQFIRDSIGDLEGLSRNYYNLAVVSKELGKKADAFIFAKNSRDLAGEIDNNLRYLESLKLLADLDPENAVAYQNEYIALHDSMQIEERKIRNKFDRIRFETEETELKNQQLSKQKLIWTGIAIGVLLLAISLFIIVDQRVKNQRLRFQQQQQEANQEIFNLMLAQKQKLEEGKQTEQKRISEELHDGILGEMNGVRMILLGLNKKGDDAAVALREQAIEKLKEVQEEIRSISHELNDASYQKFNNFISSIEELLQNSCETAGIDYHFTFDEDLDWDSLEGITKINIYRILQESLQNCIKHANASMVYVSFEINNSDLVISIQDNGRGFDATKEKKGIGHKNIKSRVNKIKGRWYLRSAIGIGTTVLVEIPLEYISQEAKKEISLPEDLQEA